MSIELKFTLSILLMWPDNLLIESDKLLLLVLAKLSANSKLGKRPLILLFLKAEELVAKYLLKKGITSSR